MSVTTGLGTRVEVPSLRLAKRRFGVEIEFVWADPDYVVERMEALGLKFDYGGGAWEMGEDSSIEAEPSGELRSPPLVGEDGARQIALACDALGRQGAKVDGDCGLHVHHDADGLDEQDVVQVLRNYRGSQAAIDQIVARSRTEQWGNTYCRALRDTWIGDLEDSRDINDLKSKTRDTNRFRVVNVSCLSWLGTIEFRQHEGTVDADEILAWVSFGQSLIAASAKDVTIETESVEELLAALQEHGGLCQTAAALLRAKARR